MGACCSQAPERQVSTCVSFARVTDSELQLRVVSSPISSAQAASILESNQADAYDTYMRTIETALKPGRPALSTEEFAQLMTNATEDAQNYFRTLFTQGKPGEAVPFHQIAIAEKTLLHLCHQDCPMFSYCNTYRSFVQCSALKRRIIEDEVMQGNTNRTKLMRIYDKEAQGTYASICRNDLECLIDQHSKLNNASLLMILKKQTVADREILRKEKAKAEALSHRPVPSLFNSCRSDATPGSDESYKAVQSRLTFFDLVDRLPEVDGKADVNYYMSEDYFTMQGKPVAFAPIKKHKSAEDPPDHGFLQLGTETQDSYRPKKTTKFVMEIEDPNPGDEKSPSIDGWNELGTEARFH